jgi:hypothetical protein
LNVVIQGSISGGQSDNEGSISWRLDEMSRVYKEPTKFIKLKIDNTVGYHINPGVMEWFVNEVFDNEAVRRKIFDLSEQGGYLLRDPSPATLKGVRRLNDSPESVWDASTSSNPRMSKFQSQHFSHFTIIDYINAMD